jgi:hypothetical protein
VRSESRSDKANPRGLKNDGRLLLGVYSSVLENFDVNVVVQGDLEKLLAEGLESLPRPLSALLGLSTLSSDRATTLPPLARQLTPLALRRCILEDPPLTFSFTVLWVLSERQKQGPTRSFRVVV